MLNFTTTAVVSAALLLAFLTYLSAKSGQPTERKTMSVKIAIKPRSILLILFTALCLLAGKLLDKLPMDCTCVKWGSFCEILLQ